jgi:Flp pilus assembly protein TadD
MAKLEIKYRAEGKALPPRPVRLSVPGWAGDPDMKKENGSQPQPWHCPLHVEGATHGLELMYEYDTEVRIVNDNGNIRIVRSQEQEPGGGPGPNFSLSVPRPPQNYLFNTSLDIQPPPGYVLRTQPHPRFFADFTGTAPVALYGHVHGEWWPKQLFIVFKIPPPGGMHVFRKGEPYVQILLVPDDEYDVKPMTPPEAQRRRTLESDIKLAKSLIGRHVWHSADGLEFNDHYKVLERAYERGGVEGVEEVVRAGVERYREVVPAGKSVPEYLELAARYQAEGKRTEAKEVLHHLMNQQPNNAEVYNRISQLEWDLGIRDEAVRTMQRAARLQPRWAPYHANAGIMLAQLGRNEEAERAFRAALSLKPNDAEVLSNLAVLLAKRGQAAEAMELSRAATSAQPTVPAAHYRAGLIHAAQGRYDEARACHEAALGLDPEFAPAREALSKLSAAQRVGDHGSGA